MHTYIYTVINRKYLQIIVAEQNVNYEIIKNKFVDQKKICKKYKRILDKRDRSRTIINMTLIESVLYIIQQYST